MDWLLEILQTMQLSLPLVPMEAWLLLIDCTAAYLYLSRDWTRVLDLVWRP